MALEDDEGEVTRKQAIRWYVCLISNTRKVAPGSSGKRKKDVINRTILVMTPLPLRVINRMNMCQEDSISSAVAYARARHVAHDSYLDQAPQDAERGFVRRRFRLVAIMGDASQEECALAMHEWDKNSRGVGSRINYGCEMARRRGLSYAVDEYEALQLDPTDYYLEVLSVSLSSGSVVRVHKRVSWERAQKKKK